MAIVTQGQESYSSKLRRQLHGAQSLEEVKPILEDILSRIESLEKSVRKVNNVVSICR